MCPDRCDSDVEPKAAGSASQVWHDLLLVPLGCSCASDWIVNGAVDAGLPIIRTGNSVVCVSLRGTHRQTPTLVRLGPVAHYGNGRLICFVTNGILRGQRKEPAHLEGSAGDQLLAAPDRYGRPSYWSGAAASSLLRRVEALQCRVKPQMEAVTVIFGKRKAKTPHDEHKRMQSSKRWVSLGFIACILSFGWLVLAFKSGTFIRDDSRYAVSPGDFTNDAMAGHKKVIDLGNYKVAYIDEGEGQPVILLHGCPFSVYEWHEVVPLLARHFRVIAPDLLGLGDTPVRLNDDYRLPEDVSMVTGLMDRLGIRSARFIGHDHGGAIVQLLMQHDPNRIEMAILTNVEAYDQWPSKPETNDLHLIVNSVTSPLVFFGLHSRRVRRDLYSIAVVNQSSLTDETLDAFASEHLASALRWQRLRRFLASQLDPANNRLTDEAVPAMRRFTKPVLILWGEKDTNFGSAIAKRLAREIPGVVGVSWLFNSAHLPMLEQSQKYAYIASRFFAEGTVDEDARKALADARR